MYIAYVYVCCKELNENNGRCAEVKNEFISSAGIDDVVITREKRVSWR